MQISSLGGDLEFDATRAILQDAVSDFQNFSIINTCEHTYLRLHSSSAIDLAICKNCITWKWPRHPIPDLWGSNHLPTRNTFQDKQTPPLLKAPKQDQSDDANGGRNMFPGCLLIPQNEIPELSGTFLGVFQDFSGTHTGQINVCFSFLLTTWRITN